MDTILKLQNITKRFGDVIACNNVSLELNRGEILAILGENGSGKTSLMNVIAGIYQPEEGQVFINGKEVKITSPKIAFENRIGMVHQHFKLVDILKARENIVLGLSKNDYQSFYEEQLEKVYEKEDKLGKRDDLITKVSALKKLVKAEPNNEQYKTDLVTSQKNLKTINNYYRYARRAKHFSPAGATERINNLAEKYGFIIDPNKKIYDMSVSEKQTIEILKVLYRGVDILILDEPTAVLTPQEIEKLFDAVRNLKKAGKSVIIITHKLNEVMEISDKVAIFRKGEHIDTVETKKTNEQKLTDMMVGHKVNLNIDRKDPVNPVDRLFIKDLTVVDKEGVTKVNHVTLTARSGEILGIAGIAGSGQKELLEAVSGLVKTETGSILFANPKKDKRVSLHHKTIKDIRKLSRQGAFYHIDTHLPINLDEYTNSEVKSMVEAEQIIFYNDEIMDLKDKNPQQIRELGIRLSFVPEDRLGMGLVGDMDITNNMLLRSYRKGPGMLISKKAPHELAEEIVHDLEVVTPNLNTPVRKLSGGNIQKVLVGREISFSPKVLMAAYPVRGLDINSSYAIYDLLTKQKERGTAVIYVGEDLDVLIALCDRIAVICNGQISGIVDARHTSKNEIGLLMTKHDIEEE